MLIFIISHLSFEYHGIHYPNTQIKSQEFIGHIQKHFITSPHTYVTNGIQDFVKCSVKSWVHINLWPHNELFGGLTTCTVFIPCISYVTRSCNILEVIKKKERNERKKETYWPSPRILIRVRPCLLRITWRHPQFRLKKRKNNKQTTTTPLLLQQQQEYTTTKTTHLYCCSIKKSHVINIEVSYPKYRLKYPYLRGPLPWIRRPYNRNYNVLSALLNKIFSSILSWFEL